MKMKFMLLSLFLLITACGGGGSSSDDSSQGGNSDKFATECVNLQITGTVAGFSNTCLDKTINVVVFEGDYAGSTSFTLRPFATSRDLVTGRTNQRSTIRFGACVAPSKPIDFNNSSKNFNCS